MSHRFPYRWYLKDGYPPKNGYKVLSTFACAGGSTMGYKLAGFDVVGAVEIDPEMAAVYKANHNPKYLFNQDIREFVKRDDLPDELYSLDILDGSPPCSTFSMAGNRESDWGREKVFREGQKKQRLDDLFFTFIELAEKLHPRVVVAENVKGMLIGKAKGYVVEIVREFERIGYKVKVFLLNAATMGVPQRRERVFFVAFKDGDISLDFNESPIPYGKFRKPGSDPVKPPSVQQQRIIDHIRQGDRTCKDVYMRMQGRATCFNDIIVWDDDVCATFGASGKPPICGEEGRYFSAGEILTTLTFPQDFKYGSVKPWYITGMSVPPVMTAQIATEIKRQLLDA